MAEAAEAPGAVGKVGVFYELHFFDCLDDQLRDSVSSSHLVRAFWIGVHEEHPQFVAIARVDQSGRVEACDSVTKSESTSGLDESCISGGNGEGDARGYEGASTSGFQGRGLARVQVGTGVSFVRVRRDWQVRIDPDEGHLEHRPTISPGVLRT